MTLSYGSTPEVIRTRSTASIVNEPPITNLEVDLVKCVIHFILGDL